MVEFNLNEAVRNLKKLMEEGKIKLLKDPELFQSLKNVKVNPDGSVVESSVDGKVRAILYAIEGARKKKK